MIGMGWIRPAATTIVVAANEGDGDQQELQHAKTVTYAVDLPIVATAPIRFLRLETLTHQTMPESEMYFVHTSISATGSPIQTGISDIFFNISDARSACTDIYNDIVHSADRDGDDVEADRTLNGYTITSEDDVREATILAIDLPSDESKSDVQRKGYVLVERSWAIPVYDEPRRPVFRTSCKSTYGEACVAAMVEAYERMDHKHDGRERHISVTYAESGLPSYEVEKDDGTLVRVEVHVRHVPSSAANAGTDVAEGREAQDRDTDEVVE